MTVTGPADIAPAEGPEEGPEEGPAEGAPAPLIVAAAVVLIEGLVVLGYGVIELFVIDRDRLTMGLTTTFFFVAFGGVLVLSAWGLRRLSPWARGPVLLAQIIGLGLAWNFRASATRPIAVGLAIAAAIALVAILHPRSVEALERAADRG